MRNDATCAGGSFCSSASSFAPGAPGGPADEPGSNVANNRSPAESTLMNSGLCPMCIRLTMRRRGVLKTALLEVFLLAVMRYFPSNVTAIPRGCTSAG
jgi:hypothetical protein